MEDIKLGSVQSEGNLERTCTSDRQGFFGCIEIKSTLVLVSKGKGFGDKSLVDLDRL